MSPSANCHAVAKAIGYQGILALILASLMAPQKMDGFVKIK
jgi:hypothetical protein